MLKSQQKLAAIIQEHHLLGQMILEYANEMNGENQWLSINEAKTTITIPLVLTGYDFDDHRNGEDDANLYTREATRTLTLILTDKVDEDVFKVSDYEFKDVDVRLACNDVEAMCLLVFL